MCNVNLGIECGRCGRTVFSITYVDGIGYCSECYQHCFGKEPEPDLVQTQAVLIKQLEDQNDRLIIERDNAVAQLATLKNVKAKEVGEAISTVVTYLADVISQKLDATTILDLAKRYNESRNLTAISKLENVLLCVDHICNSPDNEIPDMVEQLRKYIRSEIAELEGEQNEQNN